MTTYQYILVFHDLVDKTSIRMNFESEMNPNQLLKNLQIDDHKINQYIQNEYLIEISEEELNKKKLPIEKIQRVKKSSIDNPKKTFDDIFISNQCDYMYPYTYGHFVYYYSKYIITPVQINDWITRNAPNIFDGLDRIHFSANDYKTDLINKDDYIVVTNHDLQTEFGLIGKTKQIELVKSKLNHLNLIDIEYFDV